MKPAQRHWLVALVMLALVGLALLWCWPVRDRPYVTPLTTGGSETLAAGDRAPMSKESRQKLLENSVEAHLADDLNDPRGTIQTDLARVGSMIAAYRSVHSQKGNPVGDNREIVRALLGRNPNGVIFLKTGHRAISPEGELCDRWGTPFFFHAESGVRMEVRSAGPDKKLWNEDDVAIVP